MSKWVNLTTAAPGGQDEVNTTHVDWFTDSQGIFSGAIDTFLVDPREVRRAETAPSVMTMFSSDGTLCVGESLEEEIPPDEEYRYSEEYHTLYYSIYPRDPRMRVPLVRRPRGTASAPRAVSPLSGAGASARGNSAGSTGTLLEPKSVTSTLSESALQAETRPMLDTNLMEGFPQTLSRQHQQQQQQQNARQGFQSQQQQQQHQQQQQQHQQQQQQHQQQQQQHQQQQQQHQQQQQQHQQQQQQQQQRRGGTRGGTQRNGGRKGPVGNPVSGESSTNRFSVEEPSALREYLDGTRTDITFEDIKGEIVALSKDQDGSRFVQRLLDEERYVEPICNGILPNMHELMIDVFGNYVLQKVLDVLPVGSELSRKMTTQVKGRLREYCFQMYGCRVMQKIVERAAPDVRDDILAELRCYIVDCIFDQNANHVAQKIIEVMPEKAHFVTEDFIPRLNELSCHPYGCRVLQCVFEKCSGVEGVDIRPVLEAVIEHIHEYVMDQYGNYVVQHALLNAPEDLRHRLIALLIPHVYALSCSKFASNVAEKTVVWANEDELQRIVETLTRPLGSIEDGSYLVLMMQDPYANYVVQRLLQQVSPAQQRLIAHRTRPHIPGIRRSVYGQHLVQKMEAMKMFTPQEASSSPPALGGQLLRGGRKGRASRDGCGSQQSTPTDTVLTVPAGAAGPIYTYPQHIPALGDIIIAPPPPQQQPQQAQQQRTPAVALAGQSCYAGVMIPPPPPPQMTLQGQVPYEMYGGQQQQRGDRYTVKPFYGGDVSGDWRAPYAQIQHPMQQPMVFKQNAYENNSPMTTATLTSYNQQQERYPMALPQPQGQLFTHPISVTTHTRQ